MSAQSKKLPTSIQMLQKRKVEGRKISMVTCYDAAFARLIAATTIDAVLVGDSIGNVIMGYDTTLPVTVDDIVRHAAMVRRTV